MIRSRRFLGKDTDTYPSLQILETSLYVEDLDRSERFYRRMFAWLTLMGDDRMRALRMAGGPILLLFLKKASAEGKDTPRGHIPGHDGAGRLHLALAAGDLKDVQEWQQTLVEMGIDIISDICPEQGGRSLYFRDPDGHLIELATTSIWNV